MPRLDTEKQEALEPKRICYAKNQIEALGFNVYEGGKALSFIFKNETVVFYPYSGWHTGKTIKDGRGIQNLLDQLKK